MAQVCTVHELYSNSIDALATSKTGQARGSRPRTGVSSSDSEDGGNALVCLKDLDDRYEQVRSQSRVLADRLKIRLIKRTKLNSNKDEQMQPALRGSPWQLSEERPSSSFSPPKSANHKRRPRSGGTFVYTSKDRANAWISECAPKSTLLLMEKEVWVQQKEKRKRERRAQSRALRALQRRAVPFEQWMVDATEAEQIADNPIVEVDPQEPIENPQSNVNSKQTRKVNQQAPERICDLAMLRQAWDDQHAGASSDMNKKYENLLEEFLLGLCKLQRNMYGAVERIVSVTALNFVNSDDLLLVQVGFWREGKIVPSCMLPAAKQQAHETPEDALQRILRTEYKALDGIVKVVNQQTQTHWRDSPSYGVRTRYTRTLIHGRIDGNADSISLPVAMKKTRSRFTIVHDHNDLQQSLAGMISANARRASTFRGPLVTKAMTQSTLAARTRVYDHDVYLTWHNEDIVLSAWLQFEEFDFLRSPEGERQLKFLVQSAKVDPTMMPKKEKWH